MSRRRAQWPGHIGLSIALGTFGLAWIGDGAGAGPQQGTLSADEVFTGPDSVELRPGAVDRITNIIQQVRPPLSECPADAKITVTWFNSESNFGQALGTARRDVIEAATRSLNLPRTSYSFNAVAGATNTVTVNADLRPDRERPALLASSAPPKGTRVRAGETIRITIVARDHANLWQTGTKTIQIVADSDGGRFLASENFVPPPRVCSNLPPEKRVTATYVVPNNPPPIVRISAIADDAAGNTATGYLEFPTQGDWYGTITWFFHNKEAATADHNGSEVQFDGLADFTLRYDGRGNLNGALQGSWKIDKHWWGYPERGEVCSGSVPATPVSGDLVGSYTPGAETLTLHPTSVVAKAVVPWRGGGPHLQCNDVPFDYSSTLAALLRTRLQRVADGIYRADSVSTSPQHVFRYSLRVQRVLVPAP